MRLSQKINRIGLIMAAILAIVLTGAVTYLIRDYAEEQAKQEGLAYVAMAKIGLLHTMREANDGILDEKHVRDEIDNIFAGYQSIPQLLEMRSLRSESVMQQYFKDEPGDNLDAVERTMLLTGVPVSSIEIDAEGRKIFHYNGPLKASSHGSLNCMQCHHAQEGEVLGGLSVKVDISGAAEAVNMAALQILLLLVLIGAAFAYAIRRVLKPMVDTVEEITGVFKQASHGQFTRRLVHNGSDEVAEVAASTNRLMESLETHVGAIAKDVEELTGNVFRNGQAEPMAYMASVVHNLTSAVRFKEEIEADRDLDEVYAHFARMLKRQFNIHRFAVYEVSSRKNMNRQVLAEGLPEGMEGWCDTSGVDECRVKRTGRVVDSRDDPDLCAAFCDNCVKMEQQLRHICLPVINSEGDGISLQLVFGAEQDHEIDQKVMLLQYYLRVAAPEIEAKRLMRQLRESTLRDALTGMYNRRFLEEFASNLEASVGRRKSSLGVMMCDIDYFKRVNDERGHATGDRVLAETAAIFREIVRGNDLVIRYGGEEIVVLLMDTDAEHTVEVAERIRKAVEAHPMHDEREQFNISISIGVNLFTGDGKLGAAIQQADEALYRAKSAGRNRVMRFDSV